MKRNNSSAQIGDILSSKSMVNETLRDMNDLEIHDPSHDEQDIFLDEDEWGLPIDQIET
jgi:hypothetical protein